MGVYLSLGMERQGFMNDGNGYNLLFLWLILEMVKGR